MSDEDLLTTHHDPPTLPERVEEMERKVEETVESAADKVAEGVAEHVPLAVREKVRWTVKRLFLVVGGAVVLAVVLAAGIFAYYVWNHTEWAAHELTGRVNSVLLERSDVKLSVRGLSGNPLSSVLVSEPRITFRDNGAVLLAARSMRLRYSTWDLLTARHRAIVLELDHPIVNVTRGPDGKLRVPVWKTSPQAAGPARSYDFGIRIRAGDVIMPEEAQSIVGFDLDAAAATGGPTRVEIASLKWAHGPYGMRLDQLRGGIQVGDSVQVQIRELTSPDLAMKVGGHWARGGPRQLAGEIEHVRWAWLAKLFDNGALDVPGQGGVTFDAQEGDGWAGNLAGKGVWSDLRFDGRARFAWKDNRFTLDRLNGTTPAGVIADGKVIWSKQGWEVGGNATEANPAKWTVLGLKDWPAGNLRGNFRYAVDTRSPRTPHPSRLDAHLGTSEWTGWNADSAMVHLEFPAAGPDTFSVMAWRRGGSMLLLGKTEAQGWSGRYQLAHFPLDEWPDGRASGLKGVLEAGAGTVVAHSGALDVTGDLQGDAVRWFGIESAKWSLSDVKGRLLPVPDLDARARLVNSLYLGLHFDSAATPIHLGNNMLAMTDLKAFGGDTLISMSAVAEWTPHAWRMEASRAEAQSRQFHWIADPPFLLTGDNAGVTFQRVEAADGDARLHVSGRWAAPGGSYDWHMSGERVSLGRLGLPTELGLAGTADADLRVTGISGDPRWEFQGVARAPTYQGHRADSLTLSLGGAPGRLDVRDLRLAVNRGGIHSSGAVEDIHPAWPDTLTPQGIITWLSGGGRWQAQTGIDSLPLEALGHMANTSDWTGRLNGSIALSGAPKAPRFEADLHARPVSWHNVRMDEIQARASYADQKLRVTDFHVSRDRTSSNVTGDMELALALGKTPQALDAPMHWRVDLPNGDLALLPVIVPQIGFASGRFEVNGDVTGTPRHPKLVGYARVRGGRLRMAGRSEVLEDVRANIQLGDDKITMDSLTAVQRTEQGTPGRVSGHGAVQLQAGRDPTYAFDLSLRDFTAVEPGLYAARFDGDFHIANGAKWKGQVLPHVTSTNVEIRRAAVLYDFTRQSEQEQVQASTQPLLWTYQVQLHANDNLRWQPPDGNIEFSADLSVEQTPDKLIIFGDMDALRGTYYFLSNTFTISTAKLTFDDVGGVDPTVDAEASTRLIPTQVAVNTPGGLNAVDHRPSQHTITVKIQGRSSAPSVTFSDEPSDASEAALDQAQILQELTVGRFTPGTNQSLDPYANYFTQIISRQLSSELSRAFRGYINEWEIARETNDAGAGNYVVRVGSQLNDRLALRYGQALPGIPGSQVKQNTTGTNYTLVERDIEAEYRINRFFFITSQITQRKPASPGTTIPNASTPDFNVNLKARWEY
jgi:hypothetical protein